VNWARARLQPFALPLTAPLHLARGELAERRGWLVRLEGEGVAGGGGEHGRAVGVATAMPIEGFGGEDFEACGEALAQALGVRSASPELVRRAPFAASALELARLDLEARREGLPLARRLAPPGRAPAASVEVNALLGAGEVEAARPGGEAEPGRACVRALRAHGVVKLKVGADTARALRQIEAAAAGLAPGQRLRVDPNQSWSEAGAERVLRALEALPIDYVEQPVGSLEALARLRRTSPVALAADESACDECGLEAVLAASAADVVVLKPMRVGGPRAALRMAERARAAGLDVVVTSLLDSSIGVRGALAVALALGSPLRPCGLDTAGLFADDLAPPPDGRDGRMHGWPGAGLGVDVDEAALDRLALAPERTWTRRAEPS